MLEQLGDRAEVGARLPGLDKGHRPSVAPYRLFNGARAVRRIVSLARPGRRRRLLCAARPVGSAVAWNRHLAPHDLEALFDALAHAVLYFDGVAAAGMGIGQRAGARLAAQERIDRQPGPLPF